MLQVAVFVDAGYLYAQGSALLAGERRTRAAVRLSVDDVLNELTFQAGAVAPETRLLRIYWYDGLPRGNRPTLEQDEIAVACDTKLRLGMVNSQGQQKGVDSLIVTDLIELARNRAIGDALILSGDEDIRIGVQVAQTFGVRVHLLAIKPSGGSQSPDLIREADTHHEWDESIVGRWMEVHPRNGQGGQAALPSARSQAAIPSQAEGLAAAAAAEAKRTIDGLTETDIERVVGYLDSKRERIPFEMDSPTLARLRNRLGRDLTDDERMQYRTIFATLLRAAYND